MNTEALHRQVDAIIDWVVETRRALHQHPELGMEEHQTAEKIAAALAEIGIPYTPGVAGTGIIGIITSGAPGKTVALRADMDALPIQEQTGLAYASRIPGKMHACGHDAHMAIQLGAARVLHEMRNELCGTVKLLFQPAEETTGGAQPMIAAGCMDNPLVDYVLGLHVTPQLETGEIWVRYGTLTASSDVFRITVHGKSAHAAYPEESVDAIVIAAQLITSLQTIIARNVSPLTSAVLTLGKIQGGTKENIIADTVELSGTMRTLDQEVRAMMKARIRSIADGICTSMGGSCTVEFEEGYMPIVNNNDVVDVIVQNAEQLLGKAGVIYKENPSLGVEDFAFFCHRCPGAFYYLGCGNKAKGITAPGHSPFFQIDEDCLKIGVLLQAVNTLSLLNR
ncbi:MAG TPA: amidohydrolase [Firmicutes bacterium]|nr:amidohydrolase [Bacillota bacterium]HOQ24448.1 amidohydrolase [Bacillota bacterium]HPT68473.1 amidohydrolase [Bacillota bacterium]